MSITKVGLSVPVCDQEAELKGIISKEEEEVGFWCSSELIAEVHCVISKEAMLQGARSE